MEVGLLGLPRSGKTTLFEALTGAGAPHGSGAAGDRRLAVVKAGDPRLERLALLYQPKKVVPAALTFVDVAGAATLGAPASQALAEKVLLALGEADALTLVIRAFPEEGRAPEAEADLATLRQELILADLVRVTTRLDRIEKSIHRQGGEDRQRLERERQTLERCRRRLEGGGPLRGLGFDPVELKLLGAFQMMSLKPAVIVANVAEGEIAEAERWEDHLAHAAAPTGEPVLAVCAQVEKEIAALADPAERRAFLSSYGLAEPVVDRLIRAVYRAAGLITFFTANAREAHAWTTPAGTPVAAAAGRIHTDMERGFIRAEVIGWEELARAGSMTQARREGRARTEGRDYVVQDGDVIEIRFSV